MMSALSDLIVFMSETDIVHLFFPWLLLLAFTFGVLQKYEFFEEEVNGAIALSSSFLAIAGVYFFMPEGLFSNFGAILAFAAFVSMGVLIVMATAGIGLDDLEGRLKYAPFALGGLVLVIGMLALASGVIPVEETLDSITLELDLVDDLLMPLMLLGFILAVIYLSSS